MNHFSLSGLVTLALIGAALVTSQTWHRPNPTYQTALVLPAQPNNSR